MDQINEQRPVNPMDPVGEIMRRLDMMTSLLRALTEINGQPGNDDALRALIDQADYFKHSDAFVRNNQQALRAVFAESQASYEVKTRALNDAISKNAGGAHKFPAGLTDQQIFDDFTRRLAEYSAPVKEKGPAAVDSAPADARLVDGRPGSFVEGAVRLPTKGGAPRLDLLKVISTPSGTISRAIADVAAWAEAGAERLKLYAAQNSTRAATWQAVTNDERAILTRTSKAGEEIKLGIYDFSKFKKRRPGTSKRFAKLLLAKAAHEFDGEKISPGVISLNAAELVGLGLYKEKKDAREGILTAVDAFKYYGMWGKVLNTEGKLRDIWLPFITMSDSAFDGDDLNVELNPRIKWAEICAQFTYMPTMYFRLSRVYPRAADLLENIYNTARMRSSWLYQHDAFYQDLSTVARWLRLPEIEGCKYARKYIKNPVYRAIAEINDAGGGESLSLVTAGGDEILNPDLPVTEWIKGRLRVDIRKTQAWGRLSEVFEKNRKKADTAARRQEAVDTALAIDDAKKARAAERKKARTDKEKTDLAAKYAAAFGADTQKEGNK